MLIIGHAGYEFLTLKDAYLGYGITAEYLLEFNPFGATSIETPPQRSLETFANLLRKRGAIILPTNESPSLDIKGNVKKWWSLKNYIGNNSMVSTKMDPLTAPGLVCSRLNNVDNIVKFLRKGGNVLLLRPTNLLNPFYPESRNNLAEEAFKFYEGLITKLGINPQIDKEIFQKFSFNGKLIVVDGNFLTDWGTRNENYVEKINEILTEFLRFNVPVASLGQINDQMVVPLNTSVYTEWTLRYCGPDGGQIEIEIEVDPSIEPESPTVLTYSDLQYGATRTIGFWFTPRSVGIFKNAISIKTKGPFSQHLSMSLTVFSGYKEKLKGQSIAKSILLNELWKVSDKISEINDLDKFASLIEVDPRAAVMKARYIAEKISKRICRKAKIPTRNMTFEQICRLIANRNLLSKKGIGYLNTVRIIGNLAAHAEQEEKIQFKEEDALIVGQAIIEILNEVLNRDLI